MISIIIPTLNEEKVLKSTLLTLKKDLTISHQIIVSDGKSSDGTLAIARKYADKVVFYSENIRQTISAGRNAGAEKANGEFLVFMDADCQLENPNLFLTQALLRFQHDEKLVALIPGIKVFSKDETLSDQIFFGFLNNYFRLMNNYFSRGDAAGEFQMIRKEAYQSVGGFRNDLIAHEDSDMFYRLSKIGRTLYDPNLTVYHSGRRAHSIGWPRLLFEWFMNTTHVIFLNKSFSKVWEPIR